MFPLIEVFKSRLASVMLMQRTDYIYPVFISTFCTLYIVLFLEFCSCFCYIMHICHVQHYSQDDLYITAKERKKIEIQLVYFI